MKKNQDPKDIYKTFANIKRILPKKYHRKSYIVIALTLIGTVLETVGIGLVIPAVALMTDENITNKYAYLTPLFNGPEKPSHSQLAIYGALLLLSAYTVKALYLGFLGWKQSQYIFDIKAYFSQRLFEKYIRSSYEFHLQQNSGYLIRNITLEVQELVNRVLIPCILLISEIAIIVAIAILLFLIEPFGALVLFLVVVSAMYLFLRITKNHLEKWGSERQKHEGYRFQKAQEGLGGIKDVKLLGRESNFIESYGLHNLNSALVERKQNAMSNIPRLWLETIGVLGLTILVVIVLGNGGNPSNVMPIIGVFAAAAFRILPSANRILTSLQSLSYADAVVCLICKELTEQQKEKDKEIVDKIINFNKKIELRNVFYAYPNSSSNSLSDICLTINKGESIGLVGASGMGKSTLVDLILGLLKPTSGGIYVDGVNINEGLRSWQDMIGYVQQSIYLTDDTLRRNIAFGIKENEINDELVLKSAEAAQLKSFVDMLPQGFGTIVGERGVRLSGGQRQRIGIARALYHNPPFLIFDEATSALDNDTEIEVMSSIKSLKGTRTMIFIAHRLSTIEHCDKVFKLEHGQLD
jgi:ATP-binding cassette, subfamily B, bacterial PglK